MASKAKSAKRGSQTRRRTKTSFAGPLYGAVARSLKEDIANGVYRVGAQLPTEASLCRRFAVSRHTIRDALRMLRDEGLVTSRQGAGTVVVPPPLTNSFALQAMSIDELIAYSSNMHTEIQAASKERIDGKLAAQLGIAGGQEWLVVRGIARTRGKPLPVCWSDYYIHRDYAAVSRLLPRRSGPVFLLIEELFAVSVAEIEQEISTALIPPTLASSLRARAGSPAIDVRRTYRTASGDVIQISTHMHPASRFRHSMKMRRIQV